MAFCFWPVARYDAVKGAVANSAVVTDSVASENSVWFCSYSFNGSSRRRVQVVGLELDADTVEGFKGMLEHYEFALGVDECALPFFWVPGGTNLYTPVNSINIAKAA